MLAIVVWYISVWILCTVCLCQKIFNLHGCMDGSKLTSSFSLHDGHIHCRWIASYIKYIRSFEVSPAPILVITKDEKRDRLMFWSDIAHGWQIKCLIQQLRHPKFTVLMIICPPIMKMISKKFLKNKRLFHGIDVFRANNYFFQKPYLIYECCRHRTFFFEW